MIAETDATVQKTRNYQPLSPCDIIIIYGIMEWYREEEEEGEEEEITRERNRMMKHSREKDGWMVGRWGQNERKEERE